MRQRNEAYVEKQFVRYAQEKKCLALKLRIDGQKGFPDRTVICPNGEILFIEFKRDPSEKLSRTQVMWMAHLQDRGQKYCVAYDILTAQFALDHLLAVRR